MNGTKKTQLKTSRIIIMFLCASAQIFSSASAQKLDANWWTYDLLGCYHIKEGVRCDFDFTPKLDTHNTWSGGNFVTFAASGAKISASKVSVAGATWTTADGTNSITGIKTKISALFELPKTKSSFDVLTVNGYPLNKIPIKGALGATAEPTPSTVTIPQTSVLIEGVPHSVLFSNCKVKDAIYTCSSTLSPSK